MHRDLGQDIEREAMGKDPTPSGCIEISDPRIEFSAKTSIRIRKISMVGEPGGIRDDSSVGVRTLATRDGERDLSLLTLLRSFKKGEAYDCSFMEYEDAIEGQRCAACGSPNLQLDEGGFAYCLDCGMQVYAYTQEVIETQENLRHYRSTRLQKALEQDVAVVDDRVPSSDEKVLEIVEAYCCCCQAVLESQYRVLECRDNIHESVRDVIKGLWAVLLDKSGILSEEFLFEAKQIMEGNPQQGDGSIEIEDSKGQGGTENLGAYRLQRRLRSRLNTEDMLSILYFAYLWARKPVAGMDIILWAANGTIPYFAAEEKIPQEILKKFPYLRMAINASSIPEMSVVDVGIESLLFATKMEILPLNAPALLTRFIEELDLPRQLCDPCERLCLLLPKIALSYCPRRPPSSRSDYHLPPVAFLMGTLVFILKMVYGLDEEDKVNAVHPFPSPLLWKDWAQAQMQKAPRNQIWSSDKIESCITRPESMADYVKFCDNVYFREKGIDPGLKSVQDFLGEIAAPFLQSHHPHTSARRDFTDFSIVSTPIRKELGKLWREQKFDREKWLNSTPFESNFHAVVHACALHVWLEPSALADAVYLVEDHLCSLERAANSGGM